MISMTSHPNQENLFNGFLQKSSKDLTGESGFKGQEAGSNLIDGPEKTVNQVAGRLKIDLSNLKERLGTLSGAEVSNY